MIKLVLSDLDGTLLKKGTDKIDEEILNIINSLKEKNICFAVASGRSYLELFDLFNHKNDIYYISCDGTSIIYNDEIIYEKPLDERAVVRFETVKNVVFHKSKEVLYKNADEELKKMLFSSFGRNVKEINSFDKLGQIIKISKYGAHFAELPPFSCEVYKDREWCEWISNNSGKGKATEVLQKMLGIKISETAAFGDNYNDLGMLNRSSFKYVMKDAPSMVLNMSTKRVADIKKELKEITDRI